MQGLLLGQLGGFGSEVSILNTTQCSGGVLGNALQVGHGAGETVLYGTQGGTLGVDLLDRVSQSLDGTLGVSGGQDAQVGNGGFYGGCSRGVSFASCRSQTQCSQACTCSAVLDGNVLVGEQLQGTVSVFAGSHAGAGAVDRGYDGVGGVALLELDFNAVQFDRGVSGQFGLGSASRQTQLSQRAAVSVGQLDIFAVARSHSEATVSNGRFSTSTCLGCNLV